MAKNAVIFGCKGPMGKGLFPDLNNLSGHFTAFAAGTGSLVFLDLVLRIFLQNYAKVQLCQVNGIKCIDENLKSSRRCESSYSDIGDVNEENE